MGIRQYKGRQQEMFPSQWQLREEMKQHCCLLLRNGLSQVHVQLLYQTAGKRIVIWRNTVISTEQLTTQKSL